MVFAPAIQPHRFDFPSGGWYNWFIRTVAPIRIAAGHNIGRLQMNIGQWFFDDCESSSTLQ